MGVPIRVDEAIWRWPKHRKNRMPRTDNRVLHAASAAERTPPMFYRMRDVQRLTALSWSSLYRRIAAGAFAIAWRCSMKRVLS